MHLQFAVYFYVPVKLVVLLHYIWVQNIIYTIGGSTDYRNHPFCYSLWFYEIRFERKNRVRIISNSEAFPKLRTAIIYLTFTTFDRKLPLTDDLTVL